MGTSTFIAIAILPLLLLLAPYYIEPYQLWDPVALNDKVQGERQTQWCNMGWWEETNSFPIAAQALGEKLLDLAREGGYEGGGNVLVLHLSSSSPPKHLYGLTSLRSDMMSALSLIDRYTPEKAKSTIIKLYPRSAQFRPSKDLDHPLNSMKGFMGEQPRDLAYLDEDQLLEESDGQITLGRDDPPPYDLIYILDSIYHYPPSLVPFLNTLKPVLRQDKGIVVYTDILPPSVGLPWWKAWFVSYFLSVPLPNLTQRPSSLKGYMELLEKEGWKDVEVKDWSKNVWPGFAKNLIGRGGKWEKVGRTIERVEKEGWKFVAVRARKGESGHLGDQRVNVSNTSM
uniref:Uncharacterized protein n=1 Tax=Kwoniella bestiolae CBS 10118 TaxID=1296100 RepID=A0A1B9GCX3_9TREE|nr:hypothetical protein I302_00363 [Kwoniella bestiolae CBS 10118]OCF28873.1 hypothetical protein I302_00363 [Kwoniella bestiolae CBS 10118]